MVTKSDVQKIIERVASKIVRSVRGQMRGMIRRATLGSLSSGNGQSIQANSTADDSDDDVELFEQYGFTSAPAQGAEGVILRVGGERTNSVAICFSSRDSRFSDLSTGEVAVYNSAGSSIVLRANGNIEVTPSNNGVVQLGGPTATLAVARETDAVTPGQALVTWGTLVETAINSLAPGTFTPLNSFTGSISSVSGAFASISQRSGEGATCV